MSVLTVYEFYKRNWNKQVELQYKQRIEEVIANDKQSHYNYLSPLQLYLRKTPVLNVVSGVNDFDCVTVHQEIDYVVERLFIETTVEFYPCFVCDNKNYCQATLNKTTSNLDLWCIHLFGDDDVSYSFDIIGEFEARLVWTEIKHKGLIDHEFIDKCYFSN